MGAMYYRQSVGPTDVYSFKRYGRNEIVTYRNFNLHGQEIFICIFRAFGRPEKVFSYRRSICGPAYDGHYCGQVLAGRAGTQGSWSIEKPLKLADQDLDEELLYAVMKMYVLTEEQLYDNGFPRPDENEKGKATIKVGL